MKNTVKILSVFLTLLLLASLVSIFPASAYTELEQNGTHYSLDENGNATTMYQYRYALETFQILTDSSGMIFITDAAEIELNPFTCRETYNGEWFYYYGDGEYGYSKEKPSNTYQIFNAPMSSWFPLHLVCGCGRHESV